jgi:hypothetical protein
MVVGPRSTIQHLLFIAFFIKTRPTGRHILRRRDLKASLLSFLATPSLPTKHLDPFEGRASVSSSLTSIPLCSPSVRGKVSSKTPYSFVIAKKRGNGTENSYTANRKETRNIASALGYIIRKSAPPVSLGTLILLQQAN